jgi:LysW-gamma-L-alpha-aminoadipyl-6-phosphate/LysW-L-glutamyl-5-phosphate reductase
MTLNVGIVGGSGYTGGELMRFLHFHPQVQVTQVTSRERAGQYIHTVHPIFRNVSQLQFIHPDALQACDVLFLCLPHGTASTQIDHYATLAPIIVDLSADFRLNTSEEYERWYGEPHPAPQWLERFVYGLPEVTREQLRTAKYASGVGCNATSVNLALLPLVRAGILDHASIEIKVGSSEVGNQSKDSSHHPIRSGAVRTHKSTTHRHHAEIQMILENAKVNFVITSIEMVRGIHTTAHVYFNQKLQEKDLWRMYRQTYKSEPFIRVVSSNTGLHRLPEPRIVAGTNFCDVGFELDPSGEYAVIVSALDNLGKGAAGSAIQCMNLMCGFNETCGLEFFGVYP